MQIKASASTEPVGPPAPTSIWSTTLTPGTGTEFVGYSSTDSIGMLSDTTFD